MSGEMNGYVAIITFSAYRYVDPNRETGHLDVRVIKETGERVAHLELTSLPRVLKNKLVSSASWPSALASPVPGWCVDMPQSARGRKSPS